MSEKYRITLMCSACGKTEISMEEFDKHKSECASGALHDLVAPPEGDVPDTVDGPRCAEPRRWIKCEGHYFDTDSDVIVCTNKGTRTMGDCCAVNGWQLYTLLEDDEWVTHWQPMPEAPAAASDIFSAPNDKWENEFMGLPYEKQNNGASGRRNNED